MGDSVSWERCNACWQDKHARILETRQLMLVSRYLLSPYKFKPVNVKKKCHYQNSEVQPKVWIIYKQLTHTKYLIFAIFCLYVSMRNEIDNSLKIIYRLILSHRSCPCKDVFVTWKFPSVCWFCKHACALPNDLALIIPLNNVISWFCINTASCELMDQWANYFAVENVQQNYIEIFKSCPFFGDSDHWSRFNISFLWKNSN